MSYLELAAAIFLNIIIWDFIKDRKWAVWKSSNKHSCILQVAQLMLNC